MTGIRKELDRRRRMKGSLFSAKNLALLGMFIALMLLLDMMGFGYIPIGPIAITTMHIPVIIGAVYGGKKYGIILGLAFGISSWIKAVRGMSGIFTPAFINPIVSVFPRFLMGFLTALLADALYKYRDKPLLFYGAPAFVGSMVNTVFVLGLLYILYLSEFTVALNLSGWELFLMLATTGAVNGIPEALIASAVTIPLMKAMKRKAGRS